MSEEVRFRAWLLRAAIPQWHNAFDEPLRQSANDYITHSLGVPLDHPLTQFYLRNVSYASLSRSLEIDAVFAARMRLAPYPTIEEQDHWVNQRVAEALVGEAHATPIHGLTIDTRVVAAEEMLQSVHAWCIRTPHPPYTLTILSTKADTSPIVIRFFKAVELLDYLARDLQGVEMSRDSNGLTLDTANASELERKGLFDGAILTLDGPSGGGNNKESTMVVNSGTMKITLMSHSSGTDEHNCGLREIKQALGLTKRHFATIRRDAKLPAAGDLTPSQLRLAYDSMILTVPDTHLRSFSVTCPGADDEEYQAWINSRGTMLMLYYQPPRPDQAPDPEIVAVDQDDDVSTTAASSSRSRASKAPSITPSRISHHSSRSRAANAAAVGGARRQRATGGHYWLVVAVEPCTTGASDQLPTVHDGVGQRGLLMYDIETRPAENITRVVGTRSWHPHVPTILCAAYQPISRDGSLGPDHCGGVMHVHFESVPAPRVIPQLSPVILSCVDQFLKWLRDQSTLGLHYNVYAHNGGGFDHRFLLDAMPASKVEEAELLLRGHTIVRMKYSNHVFRDTCLVLQASLDVLCASFAVDVAKQTSFDLHGTAMSNLQLCFYRPELNLADFMKLMVDDPEFWTLYVSYCDKDSHSLLLVWRRFANAYETLVRTIDPRLLSKCAAASATTVGSMALKLFRESAGLKSPLALAALEATHQGAQGAAINAELRKYVRGGISHCAEARIVMSGVTGYDVTSQYPAALMEADIPAGQASIRNSDDYALTIEEPGFYQVISAVWSGTAPKFLPVTRDETDGGFEPHDASLDWAAQPTNFRASSSKIAMLVRMGWLVSYNLRSGVVFPTSIKGAMIFGHTVNALFAEKRKQDGLKGKPGFNPALRYTVKLLLNSFTGKLVENTGRYRNLTRGGPDSAPEAYIGRGRFVYSDAGRINTLVTAGLCVYEQSKMLLFERYMAKLPGGPDVAYAVETDGFYVPTEVATEFEKTITKHLGTGELGSLVREKQVEVGLFFGKKAYALLSMRQALGQDPIDPQKDVRLKGISLNITQPDGTKKSLVTAELLNKLTTGEAVSVEMDMWDHELVRRVEPHEAGQHIDTGPRRTTRMVKFRAATL